MHQVKYLWVLLKSEGFGGAWDQQVDWCSISNNADIESYREVKGELSLKVKLSIYQSIHVPNPVYPPWVVTQKIGIADKVTKVALLAHLLERTPHVQGWDFIAAAQGSSPPCGPFLHRSPLYPVSKAIHCSLNESTKKAKNIYIFKKKKKSHEVHWWISFITNVDYSCWQI